MFFILINLRRRCCQGKRVNHAGDVNIVEVLKSSVAYLKELFFSFG